MQGLCLFILLLGTFTTIVCDTWTWSEPLGYTPQPRFEHTANRVGNNLFVYGGTLSRTKRGSDLHILNLNTTRWTSVDPIGKSPGPLMGHTTLNYKSYLYVVFGSNGRTMVNDVYKLDTNTLEWSLVLGRGHVPSPRVYHCAVIVDSEIFVFGGYDGKFYLNDLYKWSLVDSESPTTEGKWEKLVQTGKVPEVRSSAAYAVHGRKLYLFGGFEVAVYKNDFYVLDLDTYVWSEVHLGPKSCDMPSARAMATLTLVGGNLVLFGGVYCSSSGSCTELNDVYQFNVLRSEFQNTTGTSGQLPPARNGHSSTLFGSKILVFGGADWPLLYNDLFSYDVYDNTWTSIDGLPPYARKHHTIDQFSLEKNKTKLVIFGGRVGSNGYSQHLHIFDLETSMWTHPAAQGNLPEPVGHHASIVKDDSWLYVFGGYNGTHSNNDVYLCDLLTLLWEKVDVDGRLPKPSHGHTVVEGNGAWFQFGGVNCVEDNCTFFNEMYSLSQETLSWSEVSVNGSIPRPRASHSWTSISPTSHIMFGGIGPYFAQYNDLYIFDEPSLAWQFINTKGPKPEPRFGHAVVVHEGKLILFGGAACTAVGQCSYFNDVFMYIPTSTIWSKLTIQGDHPAPRLGSAATIVSDIMYIYGGGTHDRMFGELLTIEPAKTAPSQSIIFGSGKTRGVAGNDVIFYIQMQDVYFVNRTTGGDYATVEVVPVSHSALVKLQNDPIKVYVLDEQNGRYTVTYKTFIGGDYNITVRVNGLWSTSFISTIIPNDPNINNTYIRGISSSGSNISLPDCTAGEECVFTIELIDKFFNKLDRKFPSDVQFIGPKRVSKKVRDLGDGNVKVIYTPKAAGHYQVYVHVGTQMIKGSPFNLTVVHSFASPIFSKTEGKGLTVARAGDLGIVKLHLFDAFSNPIISESAENVVKAELIGPDELAGSVTQLSPGEFQITYTAIKIGTYKLNIVLNDDLVRGSPYTVTVFNAPLSPATSYAYGNGLRQSIAGYRAYFTIQSADDFGNNMTTGGNQFNVLFAGPGDFKQVCNITDHGDGRYTVSYISTVSGEFMISATYWNPEMGYQSIFNSPFMGLTVASGAEPSNSFMYLENPKKVITSTSDPFEVVMGVHSFFRIQAVDRFGNKKKTGGDRFTAVLEGSVTQTGFVSDNGDGTYIGSFVAPVPGRFWLKVSYGSSALNGSPIQVVVKSGLETCPNACSNRGVCIDDVCSCTAGYTGSDCSIESGNCPGNCLGNGVCLNNTCYCYPGFAGASCAESTTLCPHDCSKHGACVEANCICDKGYTGTDCSNNAATCQNACSHNGECVNGTCLCYPGFSGPSCSKQMKFCPKGCAGRGKCLAGGMCSCFSGWTGLDCTSRFTHSNQLVQENISSSSKIIPSQQEGLEELPAKLPRKA